MIKGVPLLSILLYYDKGIVPYIDLDFNPFSGKFQLFFSGNVSFFDTFVLFRNFNYIL